MIKGWKEQQKNLLILDGGDLFYPGFSTPPPQDRKAVMNFKARAIVAAFNQMGADAITIGDNDFFWGKENLLEILEEAQFPVVSANLIDSSSGGPLFQPYIIKQIQGLRVGIFGLFPKPKSAAEGQITGLTVMEPSASAQQMVSTLKTKTDFVILLSHLGYAKDLELAKKIDGINVIVGGHTGTNLSHPRITRNTMVLQVGSKGRYLGRVDLRIKDPARPFVNVATREMLGRRLQQIERQLEALGGETSEDSDQNRKKRETLTRRKAEAERVLGLYDGYNEMVNRIVTLTDDIPADAECEGILKPYLLQISEAEKTSPPKDVSSPGSPEEQSQ